MADIEKHKSLKEKLDEIDRRVYEKVYNGYYESRLGIIMGMWEKGEAIAEYRGVKSASYYQLEKETGRQRESLKKWHGIYSDYSDRNEYKEIAELKAEKWTKEVIKKSKKNQNLALVYTGNQENYTPKEIIQSIKKVLGSIDLDPASCDFAQKIIQAKTYFTEADDGLSKKWFGNIFLNPPYQMPEIKIFTDKLIDELPNIKSAILLTNNNTDTKWFYKCAREARLICFTNGRISFYTEEKTRTQPTNGQAFFYFGKDENSFIDVFKEIGLIFRLLQ